MRKTTTVTKSLKRVLFWAFVIGIMPLIAVQFVGASPVAQDDEPVPSPLDFPPLGESGPPIAPVLIDQKTEEPENHLQSADEPQIEVWYGANQDFGQIGNPQSLIDIPGQVSTPGSSVKSLTYKLNNDEEKSLNVGPNKRRLYHQGEFHIEIDLVDLDPGTNEVQIFLTDRNGGATSTTVLVNYNAGNSWPKTYQADWSSSNNPQDVAQVVDGNWLINAGNKLVQAPGSIGYDRLVALGEYDEWTDYEAVIPFTIKGIDPNGFKAPSQGPGIGAIIRWQGYYQLTDEQPREGWQNLGALAWNRYLLNNNNQVTQGLQMIGYSQNGAANVLGENPNVQLQFNVPYFYKISVQTVNNAGDIYRFKVWPQGEPEPYGWDMVEQGDPNEPSTGSLVLIAHHVDVEFGNVSVKPTTNSQFTLAVDKIGNGAAPVVNPVQATYAYGDEVTITAAPDFGNVLGRWEGSANGRVNPLTFALTGDASITAVYVDQNQRGGLTTGVSGNGTIKVTPTKTEYYVGEQVTVTGLPNADSRFVKWTTSTANGTQAVNDSTKNPYTFIYGVDATSVTAQFALKTTYTLQSGSSGTGSGTILKNPDQGSYPEGAIVEVTAQAAAGSLFKDWDGIYQGQSNPFYILMDGNKTVSANFEQVEETYTLTVNSGPNGTVNVSPDKDEYLFGELVTLTAVPSSGYMLAGWGGDLAGNTNPITFSMRGNYNISATFTEATNPVSDDFNRCVLDNGLWTAVDPLGDATFNMTGTSLQISVPAGSPHDLFNDVNTVPRVLTPADDEDDLSIVVKFDSPVNQTIQSMGIIVQESPNKLLRFDFFYNNGKTNIYAATHANNVTTMKGNVDISADVPGSGAPLYMLIERNGDEWTQKYSATGSNWKTAKKFSYAMTVNEAGLFAGNPGAAPAFTAEFDYFFNAAQPIVPQDTNKNTVSVSKVGQGDVTVSPDKESYACGEEVTFTASPAEGWNFINWSGDLAGTANPAKLVVSGSHAVTANFSTGSVATFSFLPVAVRP